MKRVVVTGIGLLTSIGDGVNQTWNNLISCHSGIRKISNFNTDDLPCKISGNISNDKNTPNFFDEEKYFNVRDLKRNDRFILYGLAAAQQAIFDSGIQDLNEEQKLRTGVTVGSGIGGLETIYNGSITLKEKGARKISPFFIPSSLVNLLSGQISIKYGLKGPNHSVVTACATGAHSIGDASEMIKRGVADIMVAGGAEAAVCEIGIAGFCAARSLSTSFNDNPEIASRPWDKDRDGFVMGEGAGVVILEELDHAKKRNAKIYAELSGYGMSGDAYHITSPSLEGDGGYRAMESCLKMANIHADQINYINAHGTSTGLGDICETNAIKLSFGDHAKDNLVVSSTKSMTGHLLGAAGGVELAACVKAIQTNVVPPTINLDNPDPECDLDYVPHTSREVNVDVALSNSFGFGGHNASIVLKKFNE